jgi:ABC-type transporter Mla subunit MlaD
MASAQVVFLEQAGRARDRAARLRTVARSINDLDLLQHIEVIVREMEESADQLERSATFLARTVGRTGDISDEIKATIEHSKALVRRIRQTLGDTGDTEDEC